MPRFRPALALAAATLSAFVLSSCASPAQNAEEPAGEPVSGGTLIYATGDDEPPSLDPQNRGGVPQALLGSQVFESLFYQDEDGEILPWLASEWSEAEDGLSWEVTVRDDIEFSDGTPLNAEAVKVNIERVLDPATQSSTGRLALAKVTGVEVVDEFTARIALSEPDAALLESLSQVWLPIESPAAIARGFEENLVSPVGTGPFVFDSWVKQDSVTLVRNENYNTPTPGAGHEGPAYLDKIVWKFIPDPASRFAALQAGEVDVIDVIQPEHVVQAEAGGDLEVLIGSRPGNPVALSLNSGRAPFDDALVRQAFIESADIDSALESVYLGTVDRSTSILSSATKYGVDNVDYAFDPEHAAELLDDAGWTETDAQGYRVKDGQRLTVVIPATTAVPLSVGVLEQIQATAGEVGFDVQLQPLDTAAWWTANNNWEYDALPLYYTKNSADVLRLTFTSFGLDTETVGAYHSNNTALADDALDAILFEAGQVSDDQTRADLYEQAQELIVDGYYVLPIYDQQTRLGFRSDVEGIRLLPSLGLPSFTDVWLSR